MFIITGNNHKNASNTLDDGDEMGKSYYLLLIHLELEYKCIFCIEIDLELPSKRSTKSGVERMLEFGRELFQLSQRLEKDQGVNEANQKMLEVVDTNKKKCMIIVN